MLGKMILSIDKLGSPYSLKHQGEPRFRTYLGGVLTILSIMIFLAFFFLTGYDFYLRINPHLSMSKTLTNQYFNYTLKKENFLFAFRIESNGMILERPDLFYIEPHYIIFNQTQEGMKKIVDEIIPFHRCKFEDANYNEVYNSSAMSQFLCLNQPSENEGYQGGGLYDAQYIKYFKIKFSHCSAGVKANKENNITCNRNYTEFKNLFYNTALYVKYVIQSYYVDSSDYSDPFKLSFDSMYQTMELNTQKKFYLYFKKGILNDNRGWILNDDNSKELFGLDRQRLDFKDGNPDYTQNTFYEINLYFDRIVENYNRRYQKIQDVLAGVGGLIKIITFIFGNLVVYYNEHYQYLDLINNVILKSNSQNNKNDCSFRSKYDYSVNKLNNNNIHNKDHNYNHNNNKNVINNNNNNNLNNSNYNSNSYLDLNKSQQNQNMNDLPIPSQGVQEHNQTILHNQKSINHESRFNKLRSVSVFKKINDDKIQSVNSNIKNLNMVGNNNNNINKDVGINKDSNNNNVNQTEFQSLKPITKVSLSFMGYLSYYIFKKLRKKRNENFYNFIKFSDLTDKYLDLTKFLEFFSKYEPLLDQIAMSVDSNFSGNNMILNNS